MVDECFSNFFFFTIAGHRKWERRWQSTAGEELCNFQFQKPQHGAKSKFSRRWQQHDHSQERQTSTGEWNCSFQCCSLIEILSTVLDATIDRALSWGITDHPSALKANKQILFIIPCKWIRGWGHTHLLNCFCHFLGWSFQKDGLHCIQFLTLFKLVVCNLPLHLRPVFSMKRSISLFDLILYLFFLLIIVMNAVFVSIVCRMERFPWKIAHRSVGM